MSIERELKFRLAAGATARLQRELALGEPKPVHSIYFDTPERELQRARMALRLRRHGDRWLQTLKCVIHAAARHEWEMPVAHNALEPAHFPSDEVVAASGIDISTLSDRLAPVFETRFTRRVADVQQDEGALEIALDVGEVIADGRSEPIREVELELKSGAPWTLLRFADPLVERFDLQLAIESKAERGYRLAEGQALPPPRKWQQPDIVERAPGEALSALLASALEQACRNARGVLEAEDAEYLHQLRVGLRRFRSTLNAFKALAPSAEALRGEMRTFSAALGAARDWDVFVHGLSPRNRRLREARRRHAIAQRDARSVVASAAFNRFLLHAYAWLEEAPWQPSEGPLAPFAANALERLHRKAVSLADELDWSDAEQRHLLRIRVKRLRYASDSFADLFRSAGVHRYLSALERLQDRLGELNDIATSRRLIGELGGAPAKLRSLDQRERDLIAGLPRAWAAFARRPRFWKGDT